MNTHPLLEELGFSKDDRVVILHADDIGMCHSSLAAYADLLDFGLISSASVMVPCPWFPATAAFCRSHSPDVIDMGVHLTFTSEWEGYRWAPISLCRTSSSLKDEDGYFHYTAEEVQEFGDLDAIQHEASAQIERALVSGIDVTHIDTHMGSVVHPKFLSAYVQVGLKHQIPPFLLRVDEARFQKELGLNSEDATQLAQYILQLDSQGLPLLDNIQVMPLDEPDDRLEQVKDVFKRLPAGITLLNIHPAQDTPELRAIAPDWRGRVSDYLAFTSEELRTYIRDSGIHVIGWQVLRSLIQ